MKKVADAKIVGLLTRAGAWLCTTSITERTSLNSKHVAERLKALERAGRVERRESPENNRCAEWRTPD